MPQGKCLCPKQPIWGFALCQAEEQELWQELLSLPCGSEWVALVCAARGLELPALPPPRSPAFPLQSPLLLQIFFPLEV